MRRYLLLAPLLGLVIALSLPPNQVARGAPPPPQTIRYQGRLVDSNGKPLEGSVARVTINLYSSSTPSAATFLWGEAHLDVAVHRGVFSLELGAGDETVDASGTVTAPQANPLSAQVFDGSVRWLQVKVNDDPPLSPLTRLGSVPYALTAGGSVPVGGVIDWYRPDPSTPIPAGWAVCDGQTVSDPESILDGQPTPNLVGRFVRGLDPAAMTATAYGAGTATPLPDAGGQDSVDLTHAHGVAAHSHSLPGHTHPISSAGSGHQHTAWIGDQDGHNTPDTVGPSFQTHGGSYYLITFLGPGGNCTHAYPVSMAPGSGLHDHGGQTGTGGAGQTGDASGSTTAGLGPVENRPAYVGLLKLIRVK